jgi:hypothetical protein
MDVHELRKLIAARKKLKHTTFDEILQRCLRSVRRHIDVNPGVKNVLFTVPHYAFGKAIYDFDECRLYIWKRLLELGFKVKAENQETLCISWESEHSKQQQEQQQQKAAMNQRMYEWLQQQQLQTKETHRVPVPHVQQQPPVYHTKQPVHYNKPFDNPMTRLSFPMPIAARLDTVHVHPMLTASRTSKTSSREPHKPAGAMKNEQFDPSVVITKSDRPNGKLRISFD